jgi:hypothetical protein
MSSLPTQRRPTTAKQPAIYQPGSIFFAVNTIMNALTTDPHIRSSTTHWLTVVCEHVNLYIFQQPFSTLSNIRQALYRQSLAISNSTISQTLQASTTNPSAFVARHPAVTPCRNHPPHSNLRTGSSIFPS